MSRAGPVSRIAVICRDDFGPVLHEANQPAQWPRGMRETGASLILARRRRERLDILWRGVVVFKTDTTKMRRMIF